MTPAEAGIQAARADAINRKRVITNRTEAFAFIRERAEKVAICQDTEYAHLITFGGHTFKVWGDQLIEFAQMLNHDRA